MAVLRHWKERNTYSLIFLAINPCQLRREYLARIAPSLKWPNPMHLGATLSVCSLLAVLLSPGCIRQPPSEASDQKTRPAEDEPKLPFDRSPAVGGITPTSSLVPPARNVPAGTPVTIRLKSSLSSATAHSGDSFRAVLDEPISVLGTSIAPAGTPVTGEVVGLNRSATFNQPAYLELKLTSINLGGKKIEIESSSLFAKAGLAISQGGEKNGELPASNLKPLATQKKIQFGAERRLIFRLTAPVSMSR